MAIHIALQHLTKYAYDKPIGLSPQVIRLRPAPHCRTPILSYSLKVHPDPHFLNWQQDPQGNILARVVFPEKVDRFEAVVDLTADMTVINPFDFFLEADAEKYPFVYAEGLGAELKPFFAPVSIGENGRAFLDGVDRRSRSIIDFLVELNQSVKAAVGYVVRMEPGVQTPEETLSAARGSCRDSAWLMVALLRELGFAARFASGYLVQLVADVASLDGPSGPTADFTDLHAWAEVYLPGAGWVGLDATSGLLAGEGHIPLACAAVPTSAAPVTGTHDSCQSTFEHTMSVSRIREDPRVTKPYAEETWDAVMALGKTVDERLAKGDVRLTIGGEPTFVSLDDKESPEWTSDALGGEKRPLAAALLGRLKRAWAPGGLLYFAQGKWYPGESLPRWAHSCMWRTDGVPLWKDGGLLADTDKTGNRTAADAEMLMGKLAAAFGVSSEYVRPGFEDVLYYLWTERNLPENVDPLDSRLEDAEERARLTRLFSRDLGAPVGYALPLAAAGQSAGRWLSERWSFRGGHMYLIPGDSPMGLRLPLSSLKWVPREAWPQLVLQDPLTTPRAFADGDGAQAGLPSAAAGSGVVRTALCVEPRDGNLHIFLPPVPSLEVYVDMVRRIESVVAKIGMPVVIEGYTPPPDPRLAHLKITPDPGVIEVNTPPVSDWDALVDNTETLYDAARRSRLVTEKFDLDGRHTGTGGGNHVVLGGITPADSPFLRRPHLLRSLLGLWHNHPSLSYLFSGRFIGPTSQAPRVDEGRRDALYELEIAFQRTPSDGNVPPWLVDRLYRHLLVDGTGNTHRAEICIDKLYSPDSAAGRLGLVEFRAFEMPPHPRMSLVQQLLLRALVAAVWEAPYTERLIRWETQIHDRFMLPHFVEADLADLLNFVNSAGFAFTPNFFAPHLEFRFPLIGEVEVFGVHLEIREAIEPWYVLGEEPGSAGTSRYVDSSVERLQVKVEGYLPERFTLTCNGRAIPLFPTGRRGEFVAGVRYRAWQPPHCLHPTIPVDTPLVFDLVDSWSKRSLGGCTYHAAHPGGRSYDTFPVNAQEAEARRGTRFFKEGHTPGPVPETPKAAPSRDFPLTLDLRRRSEGVAPSPKKGSIS